MKKGQTARPRRIDPWYGVGQKIQGGSRGRKNEHVKSNGGCLFTYMSWVLRNPPGGGAKNSQEKEGKAAGQESTITSKHLLIVNKKSPGEFWSPL